MTDKPAHLKKRKRSSRQELPLIRVHAQIEIIETKKSLTSRIFLRDLTTKGVGLFSTEAVEKGTKISISIKDPKELTIAGSVAWCRPYTLDTKILSEEIFVWRIGVQFDTEGQDQTDLIKNYCNEIFPKKSS